MVQLPLAMQLLGIVLIFLRNEVTQRAPLHTCGAGPRYRSRRWIVRSHRPYILFSWARRSPPPLCIALPGHWFSSISARRHDRTGHDPKNTRPPLSSVSAPEAQSYLAEAALQRARVYASGYGNPL
jgi:hypothetical protein